VVSFNELPGPAFDLPWTGEHLVLCTDRELGARAVIAVDDTTRGPGVGGVRFAPYPSTRAAVLECTRLATAMTLKNAAAGLPYGGAKSVIVRDGAVEREALMRFFAHNVKLLGGRYIPGVDVGTTVDDLAVIAEIVPDVACDAEDPSPWTALGLLAGIRAAVAHRGLGDLAGIGVVVQGAGHVGAELVRLLAAEGAEVKVCDIDPERSGSVAARYGAQPVEPEQALYEACDVFAPCALARVITTENVDRLNCRIIAGAANDTLGGEETAAHLGERGILYVPDFLLNAGGVIHIHALRAGWPEQRLRAAVLEIGDRVAGVLEEAAASRRPPLDVAIEAAYSALGRQSAALTPA
jgi:leucine dehydrogenase